MSELWPGVITYSFSLLILTLLADDPAANVVGAVHDPNPDSVGARQILNCFTVDECHVAQIEDDAGLPLKGEQILQPRHMFTVHFSAKDEHNRVGLRRTLDSVCQAMPHRKESNVMASLKLLVLLDEGKMFANFSRKPQKNCFQD
jgi:hypothetical protein